MIYCFIITILAFLYVAFNYSKIKKMDEVFYLPEDIDKTDDLWKLRTINDIIIAMCNRMTSKTNYGENMEVLTEEERVFYVATEIDSQVHSLGFDHFFFDEAGRHAMEVADALKVVGAEKRAAIAQKALDIVGGTLADLANALYTYTSYANAYKASNPNLD